MDPDDGHALRPVGCQDAACHLDAIGRAGRRTTELHLDVRGVTDRPVIGGDQPARVDHEAGGVRGRRPDLGNAALPFVEDGRAIGECRRRVARRAAATGVGVGFGIRGGEREDGVASGGDVERLGPREAAAAEHHREIRFHRVTAWRQCDLDRAVGAGADAPRLPRGGIVADQQLCPGDGRGVAVGVGQHHADFQHAALLRGGQRWSDSSNARIADRTGRHAVSIQCGP